MRLRRGSPTKGLEFEIAIPDGTGVHRDVSGQDLVLATGDPNDPFTTLIAVAPAREDGPVTRDEHVRRVRAELERGLAPHLVDEGPIPLAGHESWWTIDAIVVAARPLVLDSWMLVRDGVGWTVTVRIAWPGLHRLRDSAIAIVSTLQFR